ncbi:MAG: PilN domain-containing protein [Chromatiales bacterium]|nr:PilN domain-containing protein [Chromatiales bacterium]
MIVFYAHLHVTGLIENQDKRNEFLEQRDQEGRRGNQGDPRTAGGACGAAGAHARHSAAAARSYPGRASVRRSGAADCRRACISPVLKQSAQTITLQGNAQSNARVSALMRNLDASDWFADPGAGCDQRQGRRVTTASASSRCASIRRSSRIRTGPRHDAGRPQEHRYQQCRRLADCRSRSPASP